MQICWYKEALERFFLSCRREKQTEDMDIRVGDIITLKKQHPCGSKDWEVLRIGADFRLKCRGCEHQIMIPRPQAEKNIRNVQRKEEQ